MATTSVHADRDLGRRLLRYGVFLFLLGLLTGFAVPALRNPRMGLSAHVEGVLNGMFLGFLGLIWGQLRLPPRASAVTFWLAIYGTFMNWVATLLAAAFGTSRSTPIAGAGFSGAAWQEAVVDFGLISLALSMIGCCGLVLRGLRGAAPPPR